jgi:hypothetical protein
MLLLREKQDLNSEQMFVGRFCGARECLSIRHPHQFSIHPQGCSKHCQQGMRQAKAAKVLRRAADLFSLRKQ